MVTQADLERRHPGGDLGRGGVRAAGGAGGAARNGIDRWVGGVHLRGEVARWRWDEGTESIVSAANFTLPG